VVQKLGSGHEEPNGDTTQNTWDGENRLVAVEHPDSSVTSYAYNGDGLKIEKDDGTAVTRFLYDGNNLLRELDDIGTVEAEFTCEPRRS
jgi:YD repeat-containing protein